VNTYTHLWVRITLVYIHHTHTHTHVCTNTHTCTNTITHTCAALAAALKSRDWAKRCELAARKPSCCVMYDTCVCMG
jgi:hypothetical protein